MQGCQLYNRYKFIANYYCLPISSFKVLNKAIQV
jgi:hypothetical protein